MAEHESFGIIYEALIAIGIGIGVASGLVLLSRLFSKLRKDKKNTNKE